MNFSRIFRQYKFVFLGLGGLLAFAFYSLHKAGKKISFSALKDWFLGLFGRKTDTNKLPETSPAPTATPSTSGGSSSSVFMVEEVRPGYWLLSDGSISNPAGSMRWNDYPTFASWYQASVVENAK